MTGTAGRERSCFMVSSIGDSQKCIDGIEFDDSNGDQYSSLVLHLYYLNSTVCCWTADEVAEYVNNIGSTVSQRTLFLKYGSEITSKDVWTGMRIVDKSVFKAGFNSTDELSIPIKKHRDLVLLFMHLMYTSYQQSVCPGGYLCMQGVYTKEPDDYLMTTPYICPEGFYCLPGSDSIIGTDFCPIGYYCQKGTEKPVAAQPGSFTSRPGATSASLCNPGEFSINERSTSCS